MNGLLELLLGRDPTPGRSGAERQVFVECRRCGTTLEPGDSRCHTCGRNEIVRYEIY